jgi:hypothetical protein
MSFTPVASKAVVLGSGTVLSILGPTGSSATPVHVGEVSDLKFSGWKTSTTTNTNYDSGNVEQNLGTLFSWGSLTATYNFLPNDPGQISLLTAAQSRVSYDFTLQLPAEPLWNQILTGNLYTISGIVTSAGAFDTSQTKVSSASLEITINNIVVVAGS